MNQETMPLQVCILMLAAFAIGTAELVSRQRCYSLKKLTNELSIESFITMAGK